jgi:predicted permease
MLSIIFVQLLVLYTFLVLGWLFGKWKKNLLSQTQILSFLIVNLFLPCKLFANFTSNFTVTYLKEKYSVIISSVCILAFLHFLSVFISKFLHKESYMRRIFEYSLTISNYAYMGYALMEGIWGEVGKNDLMVFCIPFSMYTYTVGYVKLTGNGATVKRVINPLTITLLLGITIGLTSSVSGFSLPPFVNIVLNNASNCVGPISMLLTGITLSSLTLKKAFVDKLSYVVVALRLVVIPAIIYGICNLFRLYDVLPAALFVAAMPTGLNTIVFPKSIGADPTPGARLAVISHLASIVTIPCWLMLLPPPM